MSTKSDHNDEPVRQSYDRLAAEYARRIYRELENKPFDRKLLNSFVTRVGKRESICDMGCGPGHVAKYLHELGANVFGLDLSPKMIEIARKMNPGIKFQVGDMFALDIPDESLGGIVSFYSICNISKESLRKAVFKEIHRVLKARGLLLISFHSGNKTIDEKDLWGISISMKFYLHQPTLIRNLLEEERFTIQDLMTREPYPPEVEYQSQRTYILAQKV